MSMQCFKHISNLLAPIADAEAAPQKAEVPAVEKEIIGEFKFISNQ